MNMISHRSRHADSAGRALGLEAGRNVYRLSVQVCTVRNRIADVDADAKPNGSISGLVAIVDRDLFLDLNGTAHRPVDAVKHYQQRISACLNDPATVLVDGWVD